ncbi:MAG: TIGR03016 family PEP-CTERM system-associated outer membrane protein [Paraglaciecola sp.]|nr:TIGR03016 family PEP-CTERM system-associated outer membrane protein [Paraglaciecola sp.]
MAIITEPANAAYRLQILAVKSALVMITAVLFAPQVQAAESKLTLSVRSALYGYEIDAASVGSTQNGAAWELAPDIVWSRESANMQTRISLEHQSLIYDDTLRENRSFNDLSFANTITALDKRISWQVAADQRYQIRNSQAGIFSDKITNSGNLSKTNSYKSSIGYQNLPSAKYRAELGLALTKLRSEQTEIDDGFGVIDTDSYSASWAFGSNERALNLFWLFDGNVEEYKRSAGTDISQEAYRFFAGIPFAPNFSLVGRIGSERIENNLNASNDYDYFGAGVEYRFGVRSRINVIMNRSDSQLIGDKSETQTFVSSDFLFAPSRRTSLEGSLDRSFYGRVLQLSGNYNLQHISIRLNAGERITTQNSLDRELQDLGIFVCPDGSSDLTDCFKPPSNRYVPVFGESLQQYSQISTELRQELVRNTNTGIALAYSKNRLKLSVNLNNSKTDYLESADFSRSRNIAIGATWLINEHNELLTNISFYELRYDDEARQDDNLSASVSYKRTLTEKSSAKLSLRRFDRNSSSIEFDNAENRVWLEYEYRF